MKNTRVIVEVAIMVALAYILEVLFTTFPGMAFGGRISLSMLPIIIIAWYRGLLPGITAGILFGVLNMQLDGIGPAAWGITWEVFVGAIFLDYLFAFGAVGLAGILRKPFGDNIKAFVGGVLIAGFVRFLFHFVSGVIFWAAWAEEVQEGMNPVLYSIIYNGTYMLPTTILLVIVGVALYKPLQSYFSAQSEAY